MCLILSLRSESLYLNIKNKKDYDCELVGHMTKEEFVSFISKMTLNEYESFARHLLHIDSSNKLLELFKNGIESFESDVDYTEFITLNYIHMTYTRLC